MSDNPLFTPGADVCEPAFSDEEWKNLLPSLLKPCGVTIQSGPTWTGMSTLLRTHGGQYESHQKTE